MNEGKYEGKVILDACCGSKMFWFNKNHPNALYVDKRKEEVRVCDGRTVRISPDLIADFKSLPFKDRSFHLVVFDPPHLRGAGKKGWQAVKYGTLGTDWKSELSQGFRECYRVLKKNGTLIFKWNEESIKVNEVISIVGVEPLIGHRTRQASKTIWLTFFKGGPQ